MTKLLPLFLLLMMAIGAAAQTRISEQSFKQGPSTTQNITSAAAGTGVDVTGYSFAAIQYKGTYTTDATAAGFQVSLDAGTTYISQAFYVQGTTNTCLLQTATGDLTDNSTNVYIVPVAGFNRVRTNALNWSSGTIAVTIVPFSSPGSPCQQIASFPALSSTTDSVSLYSSTSNLVSGVTAAITGTSDTAIISAAGSGVRIYVTSLTIINSHASVDTVVELKDGSTVIWRGWAAHGGGGFAISFPAPLRGTANTALNCAAVTTGANVYCSAAGFKAP